MATGRLITWIIILSRSDWFSSENQKCMRGSFLSIRIFLFFRYFSVCTLILNFRKAESVGWSLDYHCLCRGHRSVKDTDVFKVWLFWGSAVLNSFTTLAAARVSSESDPVMRRWQQSCKEARFGRTASGVALIPRVVLDRGVVAWPELQTDTDSQSFFRQENK